MANTYWQDKGTEEILSTHINGLQDAVMKIEQSLNMDTATLTDEPLTLIADADGIKRIAQAPQGKRNWLASPAPVIKKNGVQITSGFTIDYAGGAVIFETGQSDADNFTVTATYVKNTSDFNEHLTETTQAHGGIIASNEVTTVPTAYKIPRADESGKISLGWIDVSSPRAATLVVAASNSKDTSGADYVCDGVDDQVEINNALTALGSTGGCVLLLEGTYVVSGSINVPSNITLAGQGWGTVIKIKDGFNSDVNVIQNVGNTNIVLKDFKVDGNKANNSTGSQDGVRFKGVSYSVINGVFITSCRSTGINFYTGYSGDYNIISNNICSMCNSNGIIVTGSNNTITNNICQGNYTGIQVYGEYNSIVANVCLENSHYGIYCPKESAIVGNTCKGNGKSGIYLPMNIRWSSIVGNTCVENGEKGISLSSNSHNTVVGNCCRENAQHGIYLYASSKNNIIGNLCSDNSQEADVSYDNIHVTGDSNDNNIQANICRSGDYVTNLPRYGICINTSDCDNNLVTNNDLYTGGNVAGFSDSGTGTVVAAGNRI